MNSLTEKELKELEYLLGRAQINNLVNISRINGIKEVLTIGNANGTITIVEKYIRQP